MRARNNQLVDKNTASSPRKYARRTSVVGFSNCAYSCSSWPPSHGACACACYHLGGWFRLHRFAQRRQRCCATSRDGVSHDAPASRRHHAALGSGAQCLHQRPPHDAPSQCSPRRCSSYLHSAYTTAVGKGMPSPGQPLRVSSTHAAAGQAAAARRTARVARVACRVRAFWRGRGLWTSTLANGRGCASLRHLPMRER